MIRWIALGLALMLGPQHTAAQSVLRLELGLGAGVGGVASGPALRVGTGLSMGRWGGLLRVGGHTGESVGSLLGYPVQETVADLGGLLTYGLVSTAPHRLLVGAGLGLARGERVDPADPDQLEDIPDSWGVPFELTWYSGDGRGFGGALSVQGHLNREASYVALLLGLSVGLGL